MITATTVGRCCRSPSLAPARGHRERALFASLCVCVCVCVFFFMCTIRERLALSFPDLTPARLSRSLSISRCARLGTLFDDTSGVCEGWEDEITVRVTVASVF